MPIDSCEGVAEVQVLGKSTAGLLSMFRKMLLSLNAAEVEAIRKHYKKLGRNPTDVELETIAQTWSEHCKHKTFKGIIEYSEHGKKEKIDDLLKSTIVNATKRIARKKNWLVSVFKDNAGMIRFNKTHDVAFKVETHNHPSALDPYGGAATGIGGVIRDILGAGLGAKPIANTDVFCFGDFSMPRHKLPKGVLHPKRIAKGVRSGVRDYGNCMGIPTVNGAIIFDGRYALTPLVFCGSVGIMPRGMHEKKPLKGDLVVAVGARTGRDGIHGVTFASAGLEETSPSSPVQIGSPIEEKKVLDVLLRARDLGLYTSITDCGGGGFSSAIGEMASGLGCEVHLDKVLLKQRSLKPWEIWISESQERMVVSVPEKNIERLLELCRLEDVEATALGNFTGDKKLSLFYNGKKIAELDMEFLHKGIPRLKRAAVWKKPQHKEPRLAEQKNLNKALLKVIAMPNIASKERTIRQYDHEVQGGAVLKPLVGAWNDGPSDAAIVRPLLDRNEALIIANGINPLYGDIDPYLMAASAIDEAIRNIIAVGGTMEEIALLDNFSWGSPEKPQNLAGIVRASKACHDFSIAFGTPFISGKDSLYNEYIIGSKSVSVPGTLLVSALGVMKDSSKRVSMNFKKAGNPIYAVGETFSELGGSHYFRGTNAVGNRAPKVDAKKALAIFNALSKATNAIGRRSRIVAACHDCSEGGIAVCIAEMAIAGDLGAEIDSAKIPLGEKIARTDFVLFSESNSRFIVEVAKGHEAEFEKTMRRGKAAFAKIGQVRSIRRLEIKGIGGKTVIDLQVSEIRKAWKGTLGW